MDYTLSIIYFILPICLVLPICYLFLAEAGRQAYKWCFMSDAQHKPASEVGGAAQLTICTMATGANM